MRTSDYLVGVLVALAAGVCVGSLLGDLPFGLSLAGMLACASALSADRDAV